MIGAVDLFYFGELRERLGIDTERVEPPSRVQTVADLIGWLAERGGAYAAALAEPARIGAAVDDQPAGPEDSIFGAGDVALFPPMGAL